MAGLWGKDGEIMNGNSKREKVDSFVRRAVEEAVYELAFNNPTHSEMLRSLKRNLEIVITYNMTASSYRMKELQDIMDWKKPASGE